MGIPYVGEIRMFAGNFAPLGWMLCDGQLLPISENDVLFQLIGTAYGGDGQETFALPDLRGRVPVHMGTAAHGAFPVGRKAGTEVETLTPAQIPAHTHILSSAGSAAVRRNPRLGLPAVTKDPLYAAATALVPMDSLAVAPAGGSAPHSNLQPYLCINFIISLFGLYPNRTF